MKNTNRIFIDLEFLEDGKTIELISLGAVSDDGRDFYAEFDEFDREGCTHEWLNENVIPHLHGRTETREAIAERFKEFAGENPEFWADYGAYDWVALCQLYGRMIDLPNGWPMFVRDIQQFKDQIEQLPQSFQFLQRGIQDGAEHNALADAWECKGRWNTLEGARLAHKYPDAGMEPLP